jgi:hypothetical protein
MSPILRRAGITVMLAAGMIAPLGVSAIAQPYRRDNRGYHGHYDNRGRRGPGVGGVVGGALLGLGIGAVLGSALAPPPAVVYAPPPQQYYAPPPPPVYYGY